MKLQLLIKAVLLSLTVFLSCNDDNPVSTANRAVTTNALTGRIVNFREEANVVQANILNTGTIIGIDTVGTDSELNLILKSPANDMLISVNDLKMLVGENLYISDTSAKGSNFLRIIAYGNSFVSGMMRRTNAPPLFAYDSIGFCDVSYMYADRQVYIGGVLNQIFTSNDTTVYYIDLFLAKGWNVLSFEIRALRQNYKLMSVHAGEPPGSQWYFVQF